MMSTKWFPNECNEIGLVCIKLNSNDQEVEIVNPHSIIFDDSSRILFIEDEDGDIFGFSREDIARINFIKKLNID